MATKKKTNFDDITKKYGAERDKALADALALIEKDFGKGSLMRLFVAIMPMVSCIIFPSPVPFVIMLAGNKSQN